LGFERGKQAFYATHMRKISALWLLLLITSCDSPLSFDTNKAALLSGLGESSGARVNQLSVELVLDPSTVAPHCEASASLTITNAGQKTAHQVRVLVVDESAGATLSSFTIAKINPRESVSRNIRFPSGEAGTRKITATANKPNGTPLDLDSEVLIVSQFSTRPLSGAAGYQDWPDLSGDWITYRHRATSTSAWDISAANLVTGETIQAASSPTLLRPPKISGHYIVWSSFTAFYLYDLSTRGPAIEIPVTGSLDGLPVWYNREAATFLPSAFSIDGNRVIWIERQDRNYSVNVYDIETQSSRQIANPSMQWMITPDISGDWAVWIEHASTPEHGFQAESHALNLKTNEELEVNHSPREDYFTDDIKIDGNRVIWTTDRIGPPVDLNLFDLVSRGEPRLLLKYADILASPVQLNIWKDWIVFAGERSVEQSPDTGSNIYLIDLASGERTKLTENYRSTEPAVSDGRIAWVREFEVHWQEEPQNKIYISEKALCPK
jgi:hypothetical protein